MTNVFTQLVSKEVILFIHNLVSTDWSYDYDMMATRLNGVTKAS